MTVTDVPPIVSRRLGKPRSWTLQSYLADGGYEGLRAAVKMTRDQVHEYVNTANILGRGGAGFEAGRKWGMLRKAEPVYLTINGDESEPATFKDHALIEGDPHQLIEGTLICAYAVGAAQTFIYIRGEFPLAIERVQAALNEAYEYGAAGRNIFGSDFSMEVVVHPGAGAYICGEETAMLESLEGKRGYPRIKPPFFPAALGLYGAPTIVNNVETVANLPWLMLHGGEAYAAIGEGRSKGTKMLSLSGHVKRPGLYELEWAKATFRDLIYDPRLGGGIREDNDLKAIIPGGASSPWLGPEHLDVSLSNEAIAQVGSMAGSGSVIPMDHTTCMVRSAWRIVRFFHIESCGQCTPCREGGSWLEKILERIEAGQGRESDLDLLMDVCDNISPGITWPPAQTTICVLGPSMPPAVAAGIRMFRDEYLAHIREGRCPFPPDRLPRRLARV
ncbi:MAG TPA: NADH-quinone oxidoreductase subunit NuoF [Acidimicrobiales bacterium]|nr:NADH-quinone oxidoreductase subunit NuoF [Acidimicrobiales bacterium]